jgi:hypothetical protein
MDYAVRAMFVIDENVSEIEILRLRKARIRVRLIGDEVARIGDADEHLLVKLLRLKKPVLFTQDRDFFQFKRLHKDYALVWLDVHPNVVADYVQRFLGHPEFDTQAKRMGVVARLGVSNIRYWRGRNRQLQRVNWPRPIS